MSWRRKCRAEGKLWVVRGRRFPEETKQKGCVTTKNSNNKVFEVAKNYLALQPIFDSVRPWIFQRGDNKWDAQCWCEEILTHWCSCQIYRVKTQLKNSYRSKVLLSANYILRFIWRCGGKRAIVCVFKLTQDFNHEGSDNCRVAKHKV